MRELYSKYFKLLGNALELTDMPMPKCCVESCKSVMWDYIDSCKEEEDVDFEMLHEFVDYVNSTQPRSSNNVIPFETYMKREG